MRLSVLVCEFLRRAECPRRNEKKPENFIGEPVGFKRLLASICFLDKTQITLCFLNQVSRLSLQRHLVPNHIAALKTQEENDIKTIIYNLGQATYFEGPAFGDKVDEFIAQAI